MKTETFHIAYNVIDLKVGCVLIQASLGGTVPRKLFNDHFPPEMWQTHQENMKLYEVTREQLAIVAAKTLTK